MSKSTSWFARPSKFKCAWCGNEVFPFEFANRQGRIFCTKYHRQVWNKTYREAEVAQCINEVTIGVTKVFMGSVR